MITLDKGSLRNALGTIYAAIRGKNDPADGAAAEQLPDYGHDPGFIDEAAPMLELLYAKYFRVRLIGVENVPASGPALLVANHSGGLPYDGAMLMYAIYRDHPSHRRVRPLVANFAFRSGWMSRVVSRVGGVRAAHQPALHLLRSGQLVAVFPEGLRGVGKLYRERYRLERFGRGGFVRLAREASVPIVPVAIVGAEEIHPVLMKVTRLAEPLGIPYIPITPTFPLLGPLGLLPVPSKWTIQFGMPIPAAEVAATQSVNELAERVRGSIDSMISDLLARRRSILFG